MKIIYTNHLKLKNIPFEYSKVIIKNPEQNFIDIIENRNIALR